MSKQVDQVPPIESHDRRSRFLALTSLCKSRLYDGDVAFKVLTTEEVPGLRKIALRMVATKGTNEEIFRAYNAGGYRTKRQLCKLLQRRRRHLIAKLIDGSVYEFTLLHLCDLQHIADKLRTHPDGLTVSQLGHVARRDPLAAITHLQALIRVKGPDHATLAQMASRLIERCPRREEAALEGLCRMLAPVHPMPTLFSRPGTTRHPNLFIKVLPGPLLHENARELRFERLSDESLAKISERHPEYVTEFWSRSPMSVKWHTRNYPRSRFDWRDEDGILRYHHLENLSQSIRVTEARRILTLPHMPTRIEDRICYSAFLPWDEGMPVVKSFLHDPIPETRAEAHKAVGRLCLQNPERLSELLEIQKAAKLEPNLVRQEMVKALSHQPISRWKREHMDDLDLLMADTARMRDIDVECWRAVEHFGSYMFVLWPEHAVKWMSESMGDYIHWSSLQEFPVDIKTLRLLAPLLAKRMKRECRYWDRFVGSALAMIGKKLAELPELVSAVCESMMLVKHDGEIYSMRRLTKTLRKNAPELFKVEAAKLVEKDLTWLVMPAVAMSIVRYHPETLNRWFEGDGCGQGIMNPEECFWCPSIPGTLLSQLCLEQQREWNDLMKDFCLSEPRSERIVAAVLHASSRLYDVDLTDTLIQSALDGELVCEDAGSIDCRAFAIREVLQSGRLSGLEMLTARSDISDDETLLTQAFRYRPFGSYSPKPDPQLSPETIQQDFEATPVDEQPHFIRSLRPVLNDHAVHALLKSLATSEDSRIVRAILSLCNPQSTPRSQETEQCLAEVIRLNLRSPKSVRGHALSMIRHLSTVSLTHDLLEYLIEMDFVDNQSENTDELENNEQTQDAQQAEIAVDQKEEEDGSEDGEAVTNEGGEENEDLPPVEISLITSIFLAMMDSSQLKLMTEADMQALFAQVKGRQNILHNVVALVLKEVYKSGPQSHFNALLSVALKELRSSPTTADPQLRLLFAISDAEQMITELTEFFAWLHANPPASDVCLALLDGIIHNASENSLPSLDLLPLCLKQTQDEYSVMFELVAYFVYLYAKGQYCVEIVWNEDNLKLLHRFRSSKALVVSSHARTVVPPITEAEMEQLVGH